MQLLVQLFVSFWYIFSRTIDTILVGMILEQSLAGLDNSHWNDCATLTDTIVQQLLPRLFNSLWQVSSKCTSTFVQQSLVSLFNKHWYDCSTVSGCYSSRIQIIFLFPTLARFIKCGIHWWRILPCSGNAAYDPVIE